LRTISLLSPIGVAGNAFREIIIGHASIGSQSFAIGLLLGLFAVSALISLFTFRWN
jgi:hypothetical protein